MPATALSDVDAPKNKAELLTLLRLTLVTSTLPFMGKYLLNECMTLPSQGMFRC